MVIKFWGVRGSHPSPLTPDQVKQKISAVVQRIRTSDLESQDTRQKFLASLPDDIYSTPGGNTTCIEIQPDPETLIIIDAGTGIVELGKKLRNDSFQVIHIFFTHFHYDHVQGLPFFPPAYNPKVKIHFYSPEPDLEFTLKDHMKHPYFPITMEGFMTNNLFFHTIQTDQPMDITKDTTITAHEVRHPGRAYAYKVSSKEKSAIFAPDYEILEQDFIPNQNSDSFFHGSDLMVLDTMYTLGEAIEKINWGHSSFSIGIEFAHRMKIPKLYLFHHEPQNDDKRMYANLRSAKWFAQRLTGNSLEVYLAEEGMEIIL